MPKIALLEEDNVRTGFFTERDYHALRARIPDYLDVPFVLAYWTGMRAGEILGLRWDQVDLDSGCVRLEPGTTKTKRARHVPLDRHHHRPSPSMEGTDPLLLSRLCVGLPLSREAHSTDSIADLGEGV